MAEKTYVPALRIHALTGLYDALVAILCREKTFKAALPLERQIQNLVKDHHARVRCHSIPS